MFGGYGFVELYNGLDDVVVGWVAGWVGFEGWLGWRGKVGQINSDLLNLFPDLLGFSLQGLLLCVDFLDGGENFKEYEFVFKNY